MCEAVVGALAWKMGDAGTACASPLDCAPTCCACANASIHALSTWCNQGICATAEQNLLHGARFETGSLRQLTIAKASDDVSTAELAMHVELPAPSKSAPA